MALLQAKSTVSPWQKTLLATAIALASQTINAASCNTQITTATGACSIDTASQTMKRSIPEPPKASKRRPLRLLLHAENGTIPYLTPASLEKHFSRIRYSST